MADPKTVVTLSVGKEGIDETKEMEMEGSLAVGEIARIRVEGLPESRLSLTDANAGLALRVVANIPRPAQVVPPWTDVYRHDRDPGLVAVIEPGGWTRAEDGALVATLNMATVQAYGLFAPPQPPPPPPPRMMPMRMPPPPPPRQAVPPFGGAGATMLLEFRSGDTAQSLLGSAAFTLLPWPPDAGTSDLIDLATGRVYSKAEMDALLSTKANVQHTHVQADIAGLGDALAGKADLVGGKVPSSQLPSYVDDVLEFASRSAFPATGEAGKIYVALDTNKTYRWSGSEYVQVGGDDAPVTSVNGKTGAVVLDASNVGAASVADATLTEAFSSWTCEPSTYQGQPITVSDNVESRSWDIYANDEMIGSVNKSSDYDTDIVFRAGTDWYGDANLNAKRTKYYRLGPMSGPNANKPLAPAEDYALKSELPDVPVKAVKRNGAALVPDAQGAVNVEVPTVPTLPLSVENGGTGATTAAAARANLGAMAATANGNTILTGGTTWDGAPIGTFADAITVSVEKKAALYSIAAEYSESGSYNAGDVVWHDVYIYECITSTPSPAGEFNPSLWNLVTVAGLLDEKQDTISDLATIRSGAAAGATAVQPAQRNLLDYTTGTTLAPQTAVYRAALNADGTFPTVDATAIPTAAAYYCFELELAVPSTVPASITGPTGWTWLDGGDLPAPSVLSGGETIYVACRLDCATRAVTANVWRVA